MTQPPADDPDTDEAPPMTPPPVDPDPDLTEHGKQPFYLVRALLVTMPLAILVGTVVAPPEAFAQLFLIGATLLGGLAVTLRLVRSRRYGPVQLAAFFAVVLVGTLVGLWALESVGPGPLPELVVRLGIVLGSLLVADVVVFRARGGRD